MRAWAARMASANAIERLVLDEAHCVLQWGNSFRPAYMLLGEWKARHLAGVPVTLATATVSDAAIAELAQVFQLQPLDLLSADAALAASPSPPSSSSAAAAAPPPAATLASQMVVLQDVQDRANLRLRIVRKQHDAALAQIAQCVQGEPAIVYCLTRREAEQVCLALVERGCRAGAYHGGMPRKRREFVRKQWMGGHLSLICATSAFGVSVFVLCCRARTRRR